MFVNSFNYGLTDNISIGGGFESLSLFVSDRSPIFFVTPKIGKIITEKFRLGGGLLYISSPESSYNESKNQMETHRNNTGIVYTVGTYGTTDHNLTGGLGWGFHQGEFFNRPVMTLSGVTRIARKIALVSENWFVPTSSNSDDSKTTYSYDAVYSYGVRFFGEKTAIDIAMLCNADIGESFPLGFPYIDFVLQF